MRRKIESVENMPQYSTLILRQLPGLTVDLALKPDQVRVVTFGQAKPSRRKLASGLYDEHTSSGKLAMVSKPDVLITSSIITVARKLRASATS
jgi:hypothetical protein